MELTSSSAVFPAIGNSTTQNVGTSLYNPLMTSLAAPRKSVKALAMRSSSMIKAVDGSTIAVHKLPLLRLDDEDEITRAAAAEADEVRALAPVVSDSGVSSTRLQGVNKMRERRKQRHDDAIKAFEDFQRKYYSECEERVLRIGRDLRSALGETRERMDALFREVLDPLSVDESIQWLSEKFNRLEILDAERTHKEEMFAAALESVEVDRARVLSERLQALSAILIDVGYELTPEIERIVHEMSLLLNRVVVENKREHADVAAKLQLAHAMARVELEKQWKSAESVWRKRKHDKCVAHFCDRLESMPVKNPSARVHALKEISAFRQRLLAKQRVPLVEELASMRPPALTLNAVDRIRRQMEAVDAEEARICYTMLEGVMGSQNEHMASLARELERLRGELHTIEALSPEGKLNACAQELVEIMSAPDVSSVLSRAPSLKQELDAVVKRAGSGDVIYSAPLSELSCKVELLVQCAAIAPALEASGKGAERTALLNLIDGLRNSKKSEIPVVLVKLHKLVSSFVRVSAMPPLVVNELDDMCDELDDVINEIYEAMVAGGIEVPLPLLKFLFPERYGTPLAATTGDTFDGAKSPRKSAAGGRGSSKEPKTPRSVAGKKSVGTAAHHQDIPNSAAAAETASRGSSRSHHTSRTRRSISRSRAGSVASQQTDALSTVLGHILPFPTIRAIQRRLAILASGCELPSPIQDMLVQLHRGCQLQMDANTAVDSAVATSCTGILQQREEEGTVLLQRIRAVYDQQMQRNRETTEKLCGLFAELAVSIAVHAREEQRCDDWVTEELNGELDDFESRCERLESDLLQQRSLVAQAPDLNELQSRFEAAVTMLDCLQALYRDHCEHLSQHADKHKDLVHGALRRHRKDLCTILLLAFPDAASIDGDSTDIDVSSFWQQSDMAAQVGPVPLGTSDHPTSPRDHKHPNIGHPLAKNESVLSGGTLADLMQFSAPAGSPVEDVLIPGGCVPPSEADPSHKIRLCGLVSIDKLAEFLCDAEKTVAEGVAVQQRIQNRLKIDEIVAQLPLLEKQVADTKAIAEAKAATTAGKKPKKGKEDPELKAAEEAAQEAQEAQNVLQRATDQLAQLRTAVDTEGTQLPFWSFPIDPAGSSCVENVAIPSDLVKQLVASVREELLAQFQQYATERKALTAELTDTRKAAFTAELDERLRTHWPRRGELEVSVRAPRAQQLADHAGKLSRFDRLMTEQLETLKASFASRVLIANAYTEEVLKDISAIHVEVDNAKTVTVAQGLQSRVKTLEASFAKGSAETSASLQSTAATEVSKIQIMGKNFLRKCVDFNAGGDYDAVEIQLHVELVAQHEEAASKFVETVQEAVGTFSKSCERVQPSFGSLYQAIEARIHRISLMDGLGTTFGEPRRVAQEALRTATAWSEEAAASIDERLSQLEALQKGQEVTLSTADELCIVRMSRGLHEQNDTPVPTVLEKSTSLPASSKSQPAKAKASSKDRDLSHPQQTTPSLSAADMAARAAEDEALLARRGPASLSIKIRFVTMALRNLLYARAIYLQAFKVKPDAHGPLRKFCLPFVTMADTVSLECLAATWDIQETSAILADCEGQPHTVKGPSPGKSQQDSLTLTPYSQLVSTALGRCKEATIQLLLNEGVAVKTDDELPESLRRFIATEHKKSEDLLEYSRRRFRDQVIRCQTLLSDASVAIGADVLARVLQKANAQTETTLSTLRSQLRPSESRRLEHVEKLRLSLADPNELPLLESLNQAEVNRQTLDAEFIASIQTAETDRFHGEAVAGIATLVTNMGTFVALSEECIVPEDLQALPGDELVVPAKPSFRRLHKAMRKSGLDTAAMVAAAALGDVSAVMLDEYGEMMGAHNESSISEIAKQPPSSTSKPAASKLAASSQATKTGKSKVDGITAMPVAEESVDKALRNVFLRRTFPGVALHESPSGQLGQLKAVYSAITRHAVQGRDQFAFEIQERLAAGLAELTRSLQLAQADNAEWAKIWGSKVASLQLQQRQASSTAPPTPIEVTTSGPTRAASAKTK